VSFHVGQLVKCIRSWTNGGSGYGDEVGPQSGVVYTIREIGRLHPTEERANVRLQEIKNPVRSYRSGITSYLWEPSFDAARFVPIDETRLEVFRKIAASPRQPIEVDA